MFVYAKDRKDGSVSCITTEECKLSPWRWEYVDTAPGQGDVVYPEAPKDPETDVVEPKKRVYKK